MTLSRSSHINECTRKKGKINAEQLRASIKKYAGAGPRYTSYPTAPQFTDQIGVEEYQSYLENLNNQKELDSMGIYCHIPFCESLCYYCGCNIQIAHQKAYAEPYLAALKKEIFKMAHVINKKIPTTQMSWGGGTPTYLSCRQIEELFSWFKEGFSFSSDADISIEIDPRVTTQEQLALLRELGFNRVSLGVQDFDPKVQAAVNRIQSPELTYQLLSYCRKLGFRGINFDLIYGLPLQTRESFRETIALVQEMKPDRIALYNFAHLPELISHQKILSRYSFPEIEERVELFIMAYSHFLETGYEWIGMDHFALAEDDLNLALEKKSLYRNFMGYVAKKSEILMGIGASAVGDFSDAYFQNLRKTSQYEKATSEQDGLAVFRGILLSEDDKRRKWIIQKWMCEFELCFLEYEKKFSSRFEEDFAKEMQKLDSFLNDGTIQPLSNGKGFSVTEMGRLFIRNIAMVFDAYNSGQSDKTKLSTSSQEEKPRRYSATV